MANKDLVGFIKKQTNAGVSKQIITIQLKDNKWTDDEIREAFAASEEAPKLVDFHDSKRLFFTVASMVFILAGLGILVWVFLIR